MGERKEMPVKIQHAIGCGYRKTFDRNALADCAEGNPGCDRRRAAIRFCLELISKKGPPVEREIAATLLDEFENFDRDSNASFAEAVGKRVLFRLAATIEGLASEENV